MKVKIILIYLLFFSLCAEAQTLSPFVLSSSGGFFQAGGITLSSTLGEMTMVDSYFAANSIITQGFQQPELLTTTISENSFSQPEIAVYPNPTTGNCNINLIITSPLVYEVRVTNVVGQVIFKKEFEAMTGENLFLLDISNNEPGLYLLEVISANERQSNHIYKINLIH